jgi:release factor glutamine methyltransferase
MAPGARRASGTGPQPGAGSPASAPSTVAEALNWARRKGLDRLDAQLLLGEAMARPRAWLLAHGEDALATGQAQRFEVRCARRAEGEPLAYLLGEKEFHGVVLQVDRGVLVPRPDTETLVDWALELLPATPARPAVADLGTGSGAIALALAQARPSARVCGTDLSLAALGVARANGARLGNAVEWLQGDWWSALAGRRFDFVVSNPPYIAADDPHLPALRHEPRLALTPGGDGLGALRELIAGAPGHLNPGGWLLLEHGHGQAEAVRDLLLRGGFAAPVTHPDLAGRPRCSGGRLPALRKLAAAT